MSLSPSYADYLSRFPKTRPLNEFTSGASGVFLRHDVDHDLDLALEMAYWERDAGHRSTYFILPTASYTSDARFLLKVRQIQEFGHEIGVHLNFLASWFRIEFASVEEAIRQLLQTWRAAGLRIVGCAAHGDRLCYERDFINYWLFTELRPDDPPRTETGLSPEGVPDPDPQRSISYPPSHRLRRDDGAKFPLWSVSMSELGLRYHATHLTQMRYYSDSGGRWHRTPSPLDADLSAGAHQVLMHPEYYRGNPRRVFVVSTARSGSKWFTALAAAATPCHSVHEFSLNHRFDDQGRLLAEKRTSSGFTTLQRDRESASRLLVHTRRYVDDLKQDFLECNVYLAHFLQELRLLFPETAIVELHRNPAQVVRSIINRDWYETPEDDRHPEMDDSRWATAGQFERACLYVAGTHALIQPFAEHRISLEAASTSVSELEALFKRLGIPFYPLLAAEVFGNRVDPNPRSPFPSEEEWPAEKRALYHDICGATLKDLGYGDPSGSTTTDSPAPPPSRVHQESETLFDLRRPFGILRPTSSGVTAQRGSGMLEVRSSTTRNGRFLLGGGRWERIIPYLHGWPSSRTSYYKVTCDAFVPEGQISLYALFYDALGRLLLARPIARMSPALPVSTGTFRINDERCRWINMAVYFPKTPEERTYSIERLEASRISLSLYR